MEEPERDPKRVSLEGLDPVEALKALLAVDPDAPPVDAKDKPQLAERDEEARSLARHRLKLHAAMGAVLIDERADSLTSDEIAALIARHDLYRRQKDGKYAEGWQVARRATRYPKLFAVEGDRIALNSRP